MADQGLVRASACAIVGKLEAGDLTPLDLLDVLESRIAEVDGKVNALPTLCFERARGHAKALMALDSPEIIARVAAKVVEQALSVRRTEELIFSLMHPMERQQQEEEKSVDPNVRAAARTLEEALGVKVEIHDKRGKGKIVLRYDSLEDFDRH